MLSCIIFCVFFYLAILSTLTITWGFVKTFAISYKARGAFIATVINFYT